MDELCRPEIWAGLAGLYVQGITGQHSGVGWPGLLSGGSGEESVSKVIQVGGRIQFFAVVELKSPFSCWLSARIHL